MLFALLFATKIPVAGRMFASSLHNDTHSMVTQGVKKCCELEALSDRARLRACCFPSREATSAARHFRAVEAVCGGDMCQHTMFIQDRTQFSLLQVRAQIPVKLRNAKLR